MDVVKGIVRFHMEHNAEPEAVDLLLELDCLHLLADYVTSETCSRVGLYLITCGGYLPEPDDNEVLEVWICSASFGVFHQQSFFLFFFVF